jgi:hypothetical protein
MRLSNYIWYKGVRNMSYIIIAIGAYIWAIVCYKQGKDKGYWEAHAEIKEILKLDGKEHLIDKMK